VTRTSGKQTLAHHETPVFGSGGSYGASVTVEFTRPAVVSAVYTMIGEAAARNGCVPEAVGSTGMTNR
jgi:hypothetical protein